MTIDIARQKFIVVFSGTTFALPLLARAAIWFRSPHQRVFDPRRNRRSRRSGQAVDVLNKLSSRGVGRQAYRKLAHDGWGSLPKGV